eukprot:COSAG01_NODE_26295_length_718_cov_1.688207_1_plen_89_part_01
MDRSAAAAAAAAAPRPRGRSSGSSRRDAAVRAEVTAVTRPSPSGGTRHTATLLHARQAPRRLRGGRGAVNSAMEPEPEDEEHVDAAAAT